MEMMEMMGMKMMERVEMRRGMGKMGMLVM